MPRSRWLVAAATFTVSAACFSDLGAGGSGAASSSGGTSTGTDATTTTTTGTATATAGATTTDTMTTGGSSTTGPTTGDPTAPGACGNGIVDPGEECDDGNDVDTDGCTNACQSSTSCGDGLVQDGEACDDANDDPSDGCDACVRQFFHVFVTSMRYPGSLGGVAGGDQRCQERAAAAGLPGRYLAWLATYPDDEPSDRFTLSTVPYYLPDRKTLVANDFDDLFEGLAHPINQDEMGNSLAVDPNECSASRTVWTGLLDTGSSVGQQCDAWTSGWVGQLGNAGYLDDATQWSSACPATCDQSLHLYCFQQDQ